MRSTTSKNLKGHYDHNNPFNSLLIDNNFLSLINHLTSDAKQLFFSLLMHPEHLTWFYLTSKNVI